MTKKERAEKITAALKVYYPEAVCALKAKNPHELLIAVRLSAQCTDKRVNMITPALFEHFPTVESFANADLSEIEEYIRSCGLYKTKAKSIKEMCVILEEKFGGQVPDTMDGLLSLPGIGRKTANLIMGDLFGMKGAVVVDTHFGRLCRRMGLTDKTDPTAVEFELRELLDENESIEFCHRMINLGREICPAAGKQKCDICPVGEYCEKRI